MHNKWLLVIAGPTAVGKTELAIRLAEYYHTEIISADSRQVYRELEKGTAKPDPEELARVPHHFVNIRSVSEDYDANTFGADARRQLESLFRVHDVVVMCGGSGLYIKAALEGFDDFPDVPADTRERVNGEYREKGLTWLQQEVGAADPDYYEVVDRKNPQRLMRALEVIRTTRQPFSNFHREEKLKLPFEVLKIGLERERKELYRRIDMRMDQMVESGLFEEAEKIFPLRDRNALQTVGYREVFEFLEGACEREEAIRLLKRNSRRYAKRQLTWFKKDHEIQWFHPEDWNAILETVKKNVK